MIKIIGSVFDLKACSNGMQKNKTCVCYKGFTGAVAL